MTITSFPGATTYAKAMEILVRRGDSLDELNSANLTSADGRPARPLVAGARHRRKRGQT